MKVHHLNCGTMNPPATASVVCHVLLVETDSGLVLVDTGFGSHDCADSAGRVGPLRHMLRPVLSHEETAADQVEQLGFRRDDVRHIVVTHLDLDHIGGLSDFPHAEIHVDAVRCARRDDLRVAVRENALPKRPVGTPAQNRRTRPAGGEVARLRRGQGD